MHHSEQLITTVESLCGGVGEQTTQQDASLAN